MSENTEKPESSQASQLTSNLEDATRFATEARAAQKVSPQGLPQTPWMMLVDEAMEGAQAQALAQEQDQQEEN